MRRAVIHAPAVLLCAALAIWSTFPLVLRPGSAIPGDHPGDNLSYLWNLWWFREAIDGGVPYFWTPMLFAPFGTQLVLHTHTTLQSLLAWPLVAVTSLAAAHNIVLIAGLAANGLAAYALAYRSARAIMPSLAAALAFGGCAFVQTHLLGHFNLTHAWVIPLFAFAFIRFLASPSYGAAAFVATAAAAVVYTDYYFTVYCAAFAALWIALHTLSIDARPASRRFHVATGIVAVLLAIDVLVIAAIAATDGIDVMVGARRLSIHTVRNPLMAFWILLALFVALRWPMSISIRRRTDAPGRPRWTAWLLAAASFGVLILPIARAAARIVAEGDYVTQRVYWRSGPPGADAVTLLLGHPRHFLTGAWTESAYQAIGVGLEQIAWIGLVPLILVVRAGRNCCRESEIRLWLAVAVVFFIWSLGPFLRVAGADTALPLPWALARYVPILSNARLPGRAIVVVQLAMCMIAAIALARSSDRRAALAFALLLVLESIPSRFPLYALPRRDAVDAHLAAAADTGIVLELPAGLRDGFGEAGAMDHRALAHQTMHGRPIVGGFVARASDKVKEQHGRSRFLNGVLLLSKGEGADILSAGAVAEAVALGIRYLVVNRDVLPRQEAVSREALEQAGLSFVIADGARELYAFGLPSSPR